jgi:hypothetical protein
MSTEDLEYECERLGIKLFQPPLPPIRIAEKGSDDTTPSPLLVGQPSSSNP